MTQITLLVTRAVKERDVPERIKERQIAYRSPSADIAPSLKTANAERRIPIRLGGFVDLAVGDTGAIWRSHNVGQDQAFDKLFDLLSSRPEIEMRFLCEVIS